MRVASIIRMFTEAGCVLSFGIFLMIAILNVSPLSLVAAVGAVIVREALAKGRALQYRFFESMEITPHRPMGSISTVRLNSQKQS
jgi:hypothetical protein